MADTITLRVITPETIVLDTTAESVKVPAVDGLMGILPKHAPMVAALGAGAMSYVSGGKEHQLFVSTGFAEVRDNTLRILTPAGEEPQEIDLERARQAEARARERLKPRRTGMTAEEAEVDLVRAQTSLRRALMRQKIYGYGSKQGR